MNLSKYLDFPPPSKPIYLLVIFLIAAGLRIYELDLRPLHHDESIHAVFSYKWYKNPLSDFYRYDPVFHGPVLYFLTNVVFNVFDPTVFASRLVPLILGLLCVFSPWLFREKLGPRAAVISCIFIAISPLASYYSRFLAHDYICILASLIFLFALIEISTEGSRRYYLLSGISLGVFIATKLNSVIFLVHIFFFIGVLFYYQRSKIKLINTKLAWTVVGLVLTTVVFISSMFNNLDVFSFSTISKTWQYWSIQHQTERISGPTIYHIRSMIIHSPVLVFLIATAGAREIILRKFGRIKLFFFAILTIAAVFIDYNLAENLPATSGLWKVLKLRTFSDFYLYGAGVYFGLVLPRRLLIEERNTEAFLWYFVFANLITYSFVGEKVPWLTLYAEIPACYLSGVALSNHLSRLHQWSALKDRVVLVAAILAMFSIFTAVRVCHITSGTDRDILGQVQNSQNVTQTIKEINKNWSRFETSPSISLIGEPVWEFYFYLLSNPKPIDFELNASGILQLKDLVILDPASYKKFQGLLEQNQYRIVQKSIKHWWVPEYTKMTPWKWIQYALAENIRQASGKSDMFLAFSRKYQSLLADNQFFFAKQEGK